MTRVRLIAWDAIDARTRAAELQADGYQVVWRPPRGGRDLAPLKVRPPGAVIIVWRKAKR